MRLRQAPSGPTTRGNVPGDVLTWNGSEWLPGAGGGGGSDPFVRLVANNAGVDGKYSDGSIVLRTGGNAGIGAGNPPGAFNATALGNKAFCGRLGFGGLPIGALLSISYTWRNELGAIGVPFGPPAVVVPYCNLLVDFAPPPGPGDLRILSLLDRQLAAVISASIGSYVDAGPLHTHTWLATETAPGVNGSVCILGVTNPAVPPALPPGGCPVNVTAPGVGQFENTYRWSDLVALNPAAILVDAFPLTTAAPPVPGGNAGVPAGAVLPAISLVSGDSLNVAKSGKRITAWSVNAAIILP